MAMEWTEETIARLRELWQQGLSTAEIGRQLSVTKNAVVGKAHRLGLQARPSPIRRPPAATRAAESMETVLPVPETVADSTNVAVVAPAPVVAPVEAPVVVSIPPVAESVPAAAPVKQPDPAPQAPSRVEPEAVVEEVPPLAVPAPPVSSPAVSRPETPRAPLRAVSSPAPRRSGLSCCWPLGDPGTPGFHFCGATPVPGKPYCAEHAQLAYVKLRDRRDNVA